MGSLFTIDEAELPGIPAQVFKLIFAYTDSLALKAVVELRIADIIQAHGEPMSLSEIAPKIDSPNPINVPNLERLLRFLVRKKLFTVDTSEGEALYGLTPSSMMLQHDFELSLAQMVLTFTNPLIMAPRYNISHAITGGGTTPFEDAYGQPFWEKGSNDPEFNNLFNRGLASFTGPVLVMIFKAYDHQFRKLQGTLVDVGGGLGGAVGAIVEAHPHISGVNFDLPHVVATAPHRPGVTHVAGDMLKDIPPANTIMLKDVLHDWGDEECIKILKSSQKAISGRREGKVLIIDGVLQPNENGLLDDVSFSFDLWMMADCAGGKARTQDEWNKLLAESGFARYNIVPIPFVSSYMIIEAFI